MHKLKFPKSSTRTTILVVCLALVILVVGYIVGVRKGIITDNLFFTQQAEYNALALPPDWKVTRQNYQNSCSLGRQGYNVVVMPSTTDRAAAIQTLTDHMKKQGYATDELAGSPEETQSISGSRDKYPGAAIFVDIYPHIHGAPQRLVTEMNILVCN